MSNDQQRPGSRSDAELLAQARKGDRAAFRLLVERYQGQIAATITGMMGPSDEVDDVAQETFIRFYEALGRFRGESQLGTYLTRIAINLSLNALKRRKRLARRFRGWEEGAEPLAGVEQEDVERRELKRLTHKAIQKLSPKYRAVIVLRMIEGYSTKETADILKIPIGTVLSRLSRAQAQLKAHLAPFLDAPHTDSLDG